MDARERFLRIMNFDTTTRSLYWELGYWTDTLKRWYTQGLPEGALNLKTILSANTTVVTGEALPCPHLYPSIMDRDVSSYFHFDKGMARVPVDHWVFPWFEKTVIEETETTRIIIDEQGIKKRILKGGTSMPHFIGWPISNREDFEGLKEKFNPEDPGRFPSNWPEVVKELNSRDYPLALGGKPVGYFGSMRELMGYEQLMLGYYDDPQLIKDIMHFLTDFWISLWEKILAEVTVDLGFFWEDMSYKNGSLISPATFKEFMTPCYRRLIDFLKSYGVKVFFVDTDGDCLELIPLLTDVGVTGLYPFEVQAGMNVAKIAQEFPSLQIMGGIDKIIL